MNWKQYFSNRIIDRGYDYYLNDFVGNVEVDKNVVTSDVYGTVTYHTHITFHDNKIKTMSCTCPHYRDGNYCKHLAATLYYIEKNKLEIKNDEFNIDQALEDATKQQLQQFIKNLIGVDYTVVNKFKNYINHSIDKDYYMGRLSDVFSDYINYDYEEVYRPMDSSSLEVEALELLKEILSYDNDILDVFKVLSYGCTLALQSDVSSVSMPYLHALYDSVHLNHNLMNEFIHSLNHHRIYHLELYYEYVVDLFNEEEFKLFLYPYIETSKFLLARNDVFRETFLKYICSYLVKHNLYDVLLELKDRFYSDRYYRKALIDSYIKQEDYNNAMAIAKESLIIDCKHPSYCVEFHYIIKDIYKIINHNDYITYLQLIFLEYNPCDIDIINEYKRVAGKEYELNREFFYNELKHHENVDVLYVEDNRDDLLIDYVLGHDVDKLNKYKNRLQYKYSTLLLDKYEKEISKISKETGRATYTYMISLLKQMNTIPGGKRRIQSIIKMWHIQFKNRRLLLEMADDFMRDYKLFNKY